MSPAGPTTPPPASTPGSEPPPAGRTVPTEILVCVDGSPHADRALAWALREAQLRAARLRVLHVYRARDPIGPFAREAGGDRQTAALADVEQALSRVLAETRTDGVNVEPATIAGRGAADAILRERGGAGLIVVGSRGRGGFPGLRLGAVSQQVAAHADVPVAVVPRLPDAPAGSATDGTRAIVVGVDGSQSSLGALRWALDEGRLRGVPVTAVYVYRSLRSGAPFDAFVSLEREQLAALERQAAETARAKLDALLADVAGGAAGLGRRVLAGSPARVLINDATGADDLLVVGSRGYGGFAGLLLGSVSQQCLAHARGPVVVTPAAG